jgi:hypothetical protein
MRTRQHRLGNDPGAPLRVGRGLGLTIGLIVLGWGTAQQAWPFCAAGPDFCSSSTQCTFRGLHHTALGEATLTLQGQRLIIGNIRDSGKDGVEVQRPPTRERGGSEDWIELGYSFWEPIDVDSTGAGSSMQFDSFATIIPGGSTVFNLKFTDLDAPGFPVEIQPTFPGGLVAYEVFNGGVSQGSVIDSGPAYAAQWPVSQNFVVVTWGGVVAIRLPGNLDLFGDRLEIVPQTAAVLGGVSKTQKRAKFVPALPLTRGADLSSWRIIDERIGEGAVNCTPRDRPALTGSGSLALVALTLLALAWAVSRRLR